jgi:hypothetical protein
VTSPEQAKYDEASNERDELSQGDPSSQQRSTPFFCNKLTQSLKKR